MDVVTGLAREAGRAPGSDAERRAALWLERKVRAAGREVDTEVEWVRPRWAWLQGLHATLGVAGGLLALSRPLAGTALAAVALLSALSEALGAGTPLRRVTPERATQNLVSPPTAATRSGAQRLVRLVIVAHYDAPRAGLARRRALRRPGAFVQRLARGRLPGALGAVVVAVALVAAVSAVRLGGVDARWLDVAQLVPTLGLLLALALLVDLGLAPAGPGAGEPASGAGVAVALAASLDRSPPRHLAVELVLAGAGDGPSLGMRAFVRRRRRRYVPEATAVLHVAACGAGRPRWWTVDGPLVPRRLHPRLAELCADAAAARPALGAAPHRGHGFGAAWRARLAGWPAITVGCLDPQGLAPRAGTAADTPERLEPRSMLDALAFCRDLVDRLDADLGRRRGRQDERAGAPSQ
jgi:hypothetical protein